MSRYLWLVPVRTLCALALLAAVALVALPVAAAPPPFPRVVTAPIFRFDDQPATVTNFHTELDDEWAAPDLTGPCTDPNHINCFMHVPVFHLSFDTSQASKPIVFLGIGFPSNGGIFPSGATTTLLAVDQQPMTHHAWTLYPAQRQYQVFSDWTGRWPPGTRDLWYQGWAVVLAYDPSNVNAPPQDFQFS